VSASCVSALRFVVSLICQPDSGFKRARGIVALPSDLCCLWCASRAAFQKCPVLLCFCPPIYVVVVIPAGQRLRTAFNELGVLWFCPHICDFVVLSARYWFQACPACCVSALRFAVSLVCQPDSGSKRVRGVAVLPADLCRRCAIRAAVSSVLVVLWPCPWCASRAAASSVPGVFWFCLRICGVLVMQAGQRLQTCPGRCDVPGMLCFRPPVLLCRCCASRTAV